LGQLRILSSIGQPLVAEIDLISVQKEELSTLTARLASPEAFRQANVQYNPALIGVRLSIERRANGQPYVRLISSRPVNEPFVDLLVELSWAQGRLVREYNRAHRPARVSTRRCAYSACCCRASYSTGCATNAAACSGAPARRARVFCSRVSCTKRSGDNPRSRRERIWSG
jgi:pilus assembly protein FimV